MPKKTRKVVLPAKPGIKRQILIDNFNPVPDDGYLKNGHILFLFLQNDKSISKTLKDVTDKLNGPCVIIRHQLKAITDKLNKYQNVSRESVIQEFVKFCYEPFTSFRMVLVEKEPVPSMSGTTSIILPIEETVPMEGTEAIPEQVTTVLENPVSELSTSVEPMPKPEQSSSCRSSLRLTRDLTPREMKLKKRLDFVSQTRNIIKKKYLNKTKNLRSQINTQKQMKIKYLNQDINRKRLIIAKKDAKIAELKVQLSKDSLAKELAEAWKQCRKAKRKHRRLLHARKSKQTAVLTTNPDYVKLKNELKLKNEHIVYLENEKMILEETVKSLKDNSESV